MNRVESRSLRACDTSRSRSRETIPCNMVRNPVFSKTPGFSGVGARQRSSFADAADFHSCLSP